MAKKKNPQDATRRNVQATNKKIAALTGRIRALELTTRALAKRVLRVER